MTFDVLGPGPLDYLPCRYGSSRLLFRGPQRDLSDGYIAFAGSTETYGKFIETPFPALVEAQSCRTCVNFGQANAGLDAYCLDIGVGQLLAQADLCVLQIIGAQNMTNRFYSVHPRRNDRFLSASSLLHRLYPEVDFAEFHFTKHVLRHLFDLSIDRFARVRAELQTAWVARMRQLLKLLKGRCILLWLSDRAPGTDAEDALPLRQSEPLFVSRPMIDAVRPLALDLVEVVASPAALAAGTRGMVLSELDLPKAQDLAGPAVHAEAAQAIIAALGKARDQGGS